MKKVFRLKELDCANCAAKMERGIQQIDGVTKASVSFMTQRLTIECEDCHLEDNLRQSEVFIKQIEPDCTLVK